MAGDLCRTFDSFVEQPRLVDVSSEWKSAPRANSHRSCDRGNRFWWDTLRKMTLATDIVVIPLLILIACRPKTRILLVSAAKMSGVMVPAVLWLLIVAIFGLLATSQLPYMLGQAVSTLLILAIFAGVGLWTGRSRA